ncbi:F0F1 ATP synthase subunit A [Candidatus Avelusimicrobium aviculae]|uniref:F0F1 ATP synthase subunit A n=1 Tax=Candidatus Avelusimicrobium aviculae TaxID=3416206 RepID=UPI003D0E6C67
MDVAEIISHHILDHDWGVTLAGFRLPITTHTVTLFAVSVVLFLGLYWISLRRQSRRGRLLTTLMEEYVVFIRDGLVLPNMGQEGKRFLPYFCTLFLFVLFCALAGLVPNMKTATSNISVTAALALCSGGLILYCGLKFHGFVGFLKGFIPSGTPGWLVPLIFPLEVVSLIIKICVLAIRLFANMLSGHMVLICLLLIVFVVGQMHIAAGAGALLPAMGLELFMTCLEILVAFLQAYVFTLLTTIFAGSVIHTH